MLISVILALLIYWLSNTWHIFGIVNNYLNFAVWAIIVFAIAGYGFFRNEAPGAPRRWYLF